MTKNFTATNVAIANCMPGSVVYPKADVAAATSADAGTYHVVFLVNSPDPGNSFSQESNIIYNQALTTTPQTFTSSGIAIPANAPAGNYQAWVTVRDANWSWLNVVTPPSTTAQAPAKFQVGNVGPASLVKVSGDDQGGTVGQAQSAPMVVMAKDAAGAPLANVSISWTTTAGTLSAASATTSTDGKASVTLTHPAAPQKATITATAGSLSATFTQTSHMVLYGKASAFPALLKPLGAGDPLAGEEWIELIDAL
jgi:hypothetical protein